MARRNVLTLIGVFLLFAAVLALHLPLHAADLTPDQEQEALIVFQNVLSPYCPGRTLQDCPSSEASALKEKIRGGISAGQGASELTEDLIKELGEEFRAAPQNRGFGAWAWTAPFIFFGAGFLLFLRWALRGKKGS